LPLSSAGDACSLSATELRAVVWSMRDPRRFTAELVVVDTRFSPTLVRLTPAGLEALSSGQLPVQQRLLDAVHSRLPPAARRGDQQ